MELLLNCLTKHYGNKIAVDCVNVTLKPGVYGLLGANGAGKTTLMRMLCAILESTSGEVLLDGKEITAMSADYRDIVGLSHVANKKVKTFSGGMKQRVGIAQALLNNPKILILDEPTAGLDPKERVRFRNLLSEYAEDKIVILSTHIVSDIEAIADEVLLMKKGKFVLQGTVAELTQKAKGKVWELSVSPKEARKWQVETTVANIRHEGNEIILRIISDNRPNEQMPVFMIVLFSVGFGVYFWIFIKEKLPSYYDENEIGVYVDGILHMNMPGVVYNNNNWPYIVKALRGWSVFGMVVFPIIYPLFMMLFRPMDTMVQLFIMLGYIIGGLFLPVFVLGRKYQYDDNVPVKRHLR